MLYDLTGINNPYSYSHNAKRIVRWLGQTLRRLDVVVKRIHEIENRNVCKY